MEVQSFNYSIPYLVFLLYYVALMFIEFRFQKFNMDTVNIKRAALIGFVFFVGLRGFIFSDWYVYYPLFEDLPTVWDGGLISVLHTDFSDRFVTDVSVGKAGMEMGFIYFTLLFKSIIPNYYAWIFFNAVLDIWLLHIFLKRYTQYYILAFILFIVFGGLITECNLMRNVKAILLFLISIKYLQERKIIPYMLLNLLGLSFHSSAIVFFPLYFFLHKKIPQWVLWSIFVAGNLIFLMQIQYLKPIMLSFADMIGGRLAVQIKLYFSLDLFEHRVSIGANYLEQNVMMFLLTYFQNKLVNKNENNSLFINAYVIYFIIFFFFSEIAVAVERLTLLFVFSYWILIPELFGLLKEVVHKISLIFVLISYCFVKMILMNSSVFSRYDNLLFGIESYEDRSTKVINDLENLLNPAK